MKLQAVYKKLLTFWMHSNSQHFFFTHKYLTPEVESDQGQIKVRAILETALG